MDYRLLGRTGMRVSELCLGTMQFGWTADCRLTAAEMQRLDQASAFPHPPRPIWD